MLTEHTVTYCYSTTNGRFGSVSGGAFQAPSQTFTYGYTANSNLIATVQGPIHQVTNGYYPDRYTLLTKTNQRASNNVIMSSLVP